MSFFELKVIVYFLLLSTVSYGISYLQCKKSIYKWKWYRKNRVLPILSRLVLVLVSIYVFLRVIFIPFTDWFFND